MSAPSANAVPNPAPWGRDLGLLLLLFGALYGLQLGHAPLANPDESRYAEIPREMVATGDWVTPRLNGVVYFEKPPLVYWVGAALQNVFGPGEWAMRAIPAGFALGGILLAYAAGRRLYGRAAGLAAGAVLGGSLLFFAFSRILSLDMAVSTLMTATLFCFILGVREKPGAARRWFFYGLYASAALATLAKGLIGFLLTGAVMFFWLLLFNQWRRLRPLYLPTGLLLFLGIALPWHLLAAARNPQWASFYFIHEHWERFTTTTHARSEPWWFFLPIVLLGLFPWTGFLWPALRERLRGGPLDRLGARPFDGLRASWAARKENADAWFLVFWAAFILLFFSKSQSKLIPYILPVFPPLAVLIGAWFADVDETRAAGRLRWGMRFFGFFSGLLGAALIVAAFRPGTIRPESIRLAVQDNAIVGAVFLITGGIAAAWFARNRGVRSAFLAITVTAVGFYAAVATGQEDFARISTKELALFARPKLKPDDRVYHYHGFFHDFVYYTGREVGTVAWPDELEIDIDPVAKTSGRFIDEAEFRRQWTGPVRIWVVALNDLPSVRQLLADPTFQYHLLAETRGHLLISNRP
jgi:4-amino-4-deoxy-L-arabinose transferase-like glycosyltransferase